MKSVLNVKNNQEYKTTGKISASVLCRILFFGCFFVGIFIANTIWKNEASWIGYIHENSMLDVSWTSETKNINLMFVLISRLPIWLALMLFGKKLLGILLAMVYASWQGFAIGFILSAFIIRYGILGLAVYILHWLPHGVLYLISFWLMYRMICKGYQQITTIYMGACFILSVMFLVGIFLESYVNEFFLEKIVWIISMI